MPSLPLSSSPKAGTSGLIAWFAANPVAANLLMALIMIGGGASFWHMRKEVMPRFDPRQIVIQAHYPGAGPEEIEQALCIPIEEAIHALTGIKRLDSEAQEGLCLLTLQVNPDYEPQALIGAARARVQEIRNLPKGLERLDIKEKNEAWEAINVMLYGATDALTLKRLGQRIDDDLRHIPGVARLMDYNSDITYEVTIQVAVDQLRHYRLTLGEVAEAVRNASLDLPGGAVKTEAGELLVRAKGRAEAAPDFAALVLRTNPDGSRLRLGDVAVVKDGLIETPFEDRFDGVLTEGWEVYADSDAVDVARRVKEYVAQTAPQLPQGIRIATWWDNSVMFEERLQTLLEDGIAGFVLVFLILMLFLRTQVAFWAGAGILTSLLGALWLMPLFHVSLNLFSLFGFLLAMGILVDDAIIVGEAVHGCQAGGGSLEATIRGVQSVALPVVLAVLVALVAFLPGLALPGWAGQMMYPVCVVMILTVLFSLVEALLILPAHLATATDGGAPLSGTGFEPRPERLHAPMSFVIDPAQQRQANVTGGVQTPSGADQQSGRLDAWRARLNGGLECCVARYYRPLLEAALRWRYLTVALFAVFILLSVTLPLAGWVRLSLQADVTRDNFRVTLTPPPGTPFKDSRALAQRVEQALFDLRDSLDDHGARATTDDECHARHDRSPHPDPVMPDCPVRHPAGKCKSAPGGFVPPGEGEQGRRDFHYDCTQATGTPSVVSHLETIVLEREVAFYVEFSPDARQRYAIEDLVQDWRRRIGDIGRAKIDFLYRQGASPYDIVIEASAPNGATLAAAGAALQQALASYPGVYDVGDSYEPGKPEVRFQLKPEAERLGLRLKDVAEQVRRGFYGEEAQRFQRDGKDVKIFVRLPAAERTQLEQLRALPIRLPTGELAPLGGLANLSFSEGYAKLTRQDRRRLLQIRARVDKRLVDVNAVYAELESGVMQRLQRQQPDLKLAVGKERQEQKTMLAELGRNSLIALVVIYALIAVPFRSYSKPLIFLLAAPVAWSGAVLAHGLCGLPLSMESLVGMIAASGVVVNDSLVLLDYIREREGGLRPETGGRSAADAAFHTDPFSRPSPVSGLILEACTARFRPILLAFLTNFAGFLPTLLESSAQAQFLIPMTLSLSAGLLVGMAASLLLTPVCYALLCER